MQKKPLTAIAKFNSIFTQQVLMCIICALGFLIMWKLGA
jgi:hypothetical protein